MARLPLLPLLLAALSWPPVAALRRQTGQASSRMAQDRVHEYRFQDFVADFGRRYQEGSEEYAMREAIFAKHQQDIMQFRQQPGQSWKMGVNNFMDFTEAEKMKMLGYKGSRSRRKSDLAVELDREPTAAPPAQFFVKKPKSKLFEIIRDQGSCGSCWAQAAVSTLEGQLEATPGMIQAIEARRARNLSLPATPTLSGQTIVSCTRNPKHCGGTGGCHGATVELAYDMIRKNGGLPFAVDWPYESGSGAEPKCQQEVFGRPTVVTIGGYTVLPSNKINPLKQALVTSGGPVAVSVDASHWFLYWNGIYSDLGRAGEFTVNHAVTLMGYQEPNLDEKIDGYWKIKNSWGSMWGESGYIRIQMRYDEENHCGWDTRAHDGIACDGDPDQAWVCGTCGILYDAVFPTGVALK